MKHAIVATLLWLVVAQSAHSQIVPRQCTSDDYNTPVPTDDVDSHRTFDIPTLVYTDKSPRRVYGFDLDLLVDATGKILCQSAKIEDSETNAPRKALLASLAGWHYRPFLLHSHPAQVMFTEHVAEELHPVHHIAMPSGHLLTTKLTLAGFGYTIGVSGDGNAYFDDWNTGATKPVRHAFQVSPGEVAALLERLRAADAWSLSDAYIRHFPDDGGESRLRITVNGQTKTIVFAHEDSAGMPRAMISAIDALRQLGQFDRWFHYPTYLEPPIPAPPVPVAVPKQ